MASNAPRAGLRAVEAALERAAPAPQLGRRRRGRRGDEEEQQELPLLPAGCPVIPLGKMKQICFYLDEQGQLIELGPRDHGKTHIQSLFGRQAPLVHEYWPRYGKPDKDTGECPITGWMPEKAAEILQQACAQEGLFDPQGKVRGRGAWADDQGGLILHLGDRVYRPDMPVGEGYAHHGQIDGYVYPAAEALPRPGPGPVADDAGIEALRILRCWFWERPKIDPYLGLGFIAMAPFGGALDWRSNIWVTGDSATGKSTLEKHFLQPLFHRMSLRAHNASEAALRQIIDKDTLPVFFDEIEAKANSDRELRVIELARLAASEGVILRGGANHQASTFIARNCFYFSSILLPAMLSQDRNRMAILELKPIPKGARPPMLERERILALGAQLRRRVIQQWERFAPTLAAYKTALGKAGHGGRSADQFGTLLAFADLVLYDYEPEAELLDEWAEALRADDLAEIADNLSDSEEACEFLGTTQLQLRGGEEPEPIRRFLERALGRGNADELAVQNARRRLENHGMKLVAAVPPSAEGKPWGAREPKPGDTPGELYLAIANKHEALTRLFRDERWAKGVWSQTFARVRLLDAEGNVIAEAKRRVQVRIAGASTKATLVPIGALLDAEEGR